MQMFWYAHFMAGVSVVSCMTIDPSLLLLGGVVAIISDMDRPFGHRRWFSHSLMSSTIFAFAGFLASAFNLFYASAVFLSACSHIFLDMFTRSGVPLLHPLRKNTYGFRLFSSKSKVGNIVFVSLAAALLTHNLFPQILSSVL